LTNSVESSNQNNLNNFSQSCPLTFMLHDVTENSIKCNFLPGIDSISPKFIKNG